MKSLMEFVKAKRGIILLIAIVVILLATRFLPIGAGDFYSDNALNSFRAYGWLDYFGTTGQTTPIQWFGNIPGWALLSFHDAPPLAFLVQYVFFVLLGGGTVVARLPFVLAGVASVWLVYYLLKKNSNATIATIAAMAYAVLSLAAWTGQAAYLEGIEIFFIAGSILFGAYFLFKEQKNKFIYAWAIFLALALLTKYTAVFLIPPIIIYGLIYRRELIGKWKHVLLSLALFAVLISPVVVYNSYVFQTRGHLDAALSSMIGMQSDDFQILGGRSPQYNVFNNTISALQVLWDNISYPFLILAAICFIVLIVRAYRNGLRGLESWVLINTVFMFIVLGFAGASIRFLSIIAPLLAIIMGMGTYYLYEFIRYKNQRLANVYAVLLIAIAVFELFYSINTNVLKTPIGTSGWLHSGNKVDNLGFNQLESFIRETVIVQLPEKKVIRERKDFFFGRDDIKGKSVVIFDDKINWFAQMWYFQRYFLYHRWPVISTAFLSSTNANSVTIEDVMEVSGEPLYFIYPVNNSVIDPKREADQGINSVGIDLVRRFDSMSSATTTLIKNSNGDPVFKIYKVDRL